MTIQARNNFKAKGSFLMCGILWILLLLTTCNIKKVDASSLGPPPISNINSAASINKASIDSTNRSNIIPNNENASPVAPVLPEIDTAADLPITDASSAFAAKYAAAALVTGDILATTANNPKPGNGSSESSNSGGWFGKILGKGSASSSDNGKNPIVAQGGGKVELPPPPPPPPLNQMSNSQQQPKNNQWMSSGPMKPQQLQQQSKQQRYRQQPMPPNANYNPYATGNNYPPYNPPPSYIDPAAYQNLLYELDESTLREMTLTHQLHNLSAYVDTLTSESENLVMRIDVLTERLADTNANFNFVHNRNLELDANCTQLASTVESLREEIAGYETMMTNMEEEKGENEKILVELRGELRRVTDELEQLACLVETERFEMEKGDFLKDFKKKQGSKRRKKRGFWAWLFGFESDEKEDDHPEEEHERLRAAQELARSTLLHALQTERSSVEELEAAVITLQRNNSAIMDVVQSRNSLINELNDRVAVFEEDKMVLKAALRQLQKEIREEGPKLEKAQEGERRLNEELDQLKLDYQEEIEEWQQRLEEGETEWNQTKEELFLIGTYVDQLEDRLATFAIAKKEIEVREKQCQELEVEAKKHAKEAESWKSQVDALAREQGETKPLLEDLVKERAETRVKMDSLLNEIKQLNGQIEAWKQKVEEAEQRSEEIKSQSARQLFLRIEECKREWEADTAHKMDQQKRLWDAANTEEWEKALETEKASWQAQNSQDFAHQLAQEKACWEANMRECESQLETRLSQEWNAKLDSQRSELETHFQEALRQRLDMELVKWQEQKDHEVQQRLSEARVSWEAERSLNSVHNTSSLEDEIEKAAHKVHDRLEKNDLSFGATEPSLQSVHDLLRADDAEHKNTLDITTGSNSSTNTTDLLTTNGTQRNFTTTQKPQRQTRSVPLRTARKAFARATGIHGFITPSSVQLRQRSMQARKPPKKAPVKKKSEHDNSLYQKDENTTELSASQASTDAEVENQVWDTESEKISDIPSDLSTGGDDFYHTQTENWNYESDGGVELMSLVEPPTLPDFDDR